MHATRPQVLGGSLHDVAITARARQNVSQGISMPLLGVEPLQKSYAFFMIDDGVMTRWFFYSGSFSMLEFAKKVGDLSANRESIHINASGPCWRTHPDPDKGIPSKHVEQLLGKICYTCANCHIMAPNCTKACYKCRFARYCSKKCQEEHWSAHKKECPFITRVYNRTEKRDGESQYSREPKLWPYDPNTNRRAEPRRAQIYYGLTNRYDYQLMQFILSKHVMLPYDASTRSDATLVSYLYRGKQTRQRLRHLRPPVMATVDEDDNPRHNDDWKWEQHSGDFHAPERPSGFQGPEIFTARCHVAD